MHSGTVVKPFDVIDDASGCLFMGLELFVVDLFYFKASIEAFHRRVVVAVSFTTHALPERVLLEPLAIRQACVLRSTIAVND